MAADREEERLAALARYAILDTSPEAAFDDVAKLAAALCDTPMALVSLVDRDRQWFKSMVGLDITETPRAISFCSHAIEGDGPFIVDDAAADERFASNPLVTGAPSLRFYAGVPLLEEHDGLPLGTLCVLDTRPRELTELQLRTLRVLAKQVVAQLEVRKLLAREKSLHEEVIRAHRHATFLADASKLLAASLDTDQTLEAVARLTVPTFGDVCSFVVCAEDGSLRRVGEAGRDLASTSGIRSLREDVTDGGTIAMRHAIEARKAILFDDYLGWIEQRLGAADPYVRTIRQLDVRTAIAAPLMVAGRVVGVLSVGVQGEDARLFRADDVATMTELAQRAAVALENARLYSEAMVERERAETANRSKDVFLASVSHDLRTPLSAILGWTQLVRSQPDDKALQERAMLVIERSAHAQSRLIEDLLDISRIVAGQLTIDLGSLDLLSVIDGALETVKQAAVERGVELVKSLGQEPMTALGDVGRLQQVVWNLVSNAIKFSKTGGRVEVLLERADPFARLTVKDDGTGISPQLLPKIFERFRQDDRGVGRRMGGLGLGLSIAKHIVEATGGTISAHSDGEGTGATFVVMLPLTTSIPVPLPALSRPRGGPGA
jgi:signal transduction histidine kinase